IYLDKDNLNIIHEKKVSGCIFIKLTEDKLKEWEVANGSAELNHLKLYD
ncbi:8231_t:CDS:1, partial [Rhizophagus irregularis]